MTDLYAILIELDRGETIHLKPDDEVTVTADGEDTDVPARHLDDLWRHEGFDFLTTAGEVELEKPADSRWEDGDVFDRDAIGTVKASHIRRIFRVERQGERTA